jgi:NADPH2:quinone reductase
MPDSAKKAAIKDITTFLSDNKLDNRIAGTYPLDEIAKAHQTIEKGNVYGSVIITL